MALISFLSKKSMTKSKQLRNKNRSNWDIVKDPVRSESNRWKIECIECSKVLSIRDGVGGQVIFIIYLLNTWSSRNKSSVILLEFCCFKCDYMSRTTDMRLTRLAAETTRDQKKQSWPDEPLVKDSLTLIKEFKQSFDFALFAFNYDQERTMEVKQGPKRDE